MGKFKEMTIMTESKIPVAEETKVDQLSEESQEAEQTPRNQPVEVENRYYCESATDLDCACFVSAVIAAASAGTGAVGAFIGDPKLTSFLVPAIVSACFSGWNYLQLKNWIDDTSNVDSPYVVLSVAAMVKREAQKAERKRASGLTKTVEQSYLTFLGIPRLTDCEEDGREIEISYNPDEEEVIITHQGVYYEPCCMEGQRKRCTVSDNSYIIKRLNPTTVGIESTIHGYFRTGDEYREYSEGFPSYRYYLNKTATNPSSSSNTTYYQVPENFSLEQGLNPSIMTRIEVPEEEHSRQYVRK